MKISRILVLLFGLCILFSTVTFAKTKPVLDITNPSVQLLKTLNDEGKIIRQADESVCLPDMSADINRTTQKKIEFEKIKKQAFPSLYKSNKQ